MKKMVAILTVVLVILTASVTLAATSIQENYIHQEVVNIYKKVANDGINVSKNSSTMKTKVQGLLNSYSEYISVEDIANLNTLVTMFEEFAVSGDAARDFAYAACPVIND